MSDKNELKIAYVIAVVCLIVGVVCYTTLPAKVPDEPVRVLFECTGEDVLFRHMTHSDDYDLKCADCHHPIAHEEGQKEASCSSCHTGDSQRVPSFGEKGLFDHETHSQYYGLSCTDCHHMWDPEGGSEPMNCGACHMDTGDEYMPSLTDSYHQQCIGCHEEWGVEPTTKDCNACHKPRKRTEAFHDQCTNCHDSKGAGPVKDDCRGCHGY